ncbi:hypothetical protein P389DRAFT_106727 [Cystobasidium minutum MCA 4210]|uniref:uncharacterized protein n=1 Tax=Cystobasidium minutum MCA 4210 TaxID=1397322 RepID=UPI0034CEA3B6|eukprot:jgi/Rhomi1/106727/CE106726_651
MLKAVSGSIRIGRRRFPRPVPPLHIRPNTTAAVDACAARSHERSDEPEHVSVSLHKSARPVEHSSATSFPFYYQSYTPQASTSKSTIPAPPSHNEVLRTTTTPSTCFRRQRRARRYLRVVTKSLSKLSKSHLSRRAQAQLVHKLLSKLASSLPTSEDSQGEPLFSAKLLHSFLNAFQGWLSHFDVSRNTGIRNLASIASVYAQLLPVLIANVDSIQSKRLHQAMLEEQVCLVKSLATQLTFENLSQLLSLLSPKNWVSLPSIVLDTLADTVLQCDAACETLHRAMLKMSLNPSRDLTQHARLHQLHRHLLEQQLHKQQTFSRMFGPEPRRQSLYSGLKYMISSTVLSDRLTLGECSIQQLKRPLDLARKFRNLYLPPDRQVMAAVLHLALLGDDNVRRILEIDGTLGWLWREWTVLRENEPDREVDDVLLVGFLETAGAVSGSHAAAEVEGSMQDGSPLWILQAYDIAQNKASLGFDADKSAMQYQVGRDVPPHLNKRLLRTLAVLAMHLGHFDTSFACLLDPRLPPRHIIPILHRLASTVNTLNSSDHKLSQAVARAASEHLTHISTRVPRSLSVKHAAQLTDFISMLIREGHLTSAEAFLHVPQSPLQFGENNLHKIITILSKANGTETLQRLYRSVPPLRWPAGLVCSFLGSPHSQVSDLVWLDVESRADADKARYLHARLLHHLRCSPLRYMRSKEEYNAVVKTSKAAPPIRTQLLMLDIHIRAGSGQRAQRLYNDLRDMQGLSPEEAKVLSSELDVRFLKMAGLPAQAGFRKRGPRSQLSRLGAHLDQLLSRGSSLDAASARYLLMQSLRWAELDEDAIWAIFNSAMMNASNLDWRRDLQPLVNAVKHAFRKRGSYDAECEVDRQAAEIKRRGSKPGN